VGLPDTQGRKPDVARRDRSTGADIRYMPTIAFMLFPHLTASDVIAPLDALQTLSHIGDWEVTTVSAGRDPVPCTGPVSLQADRTYGDLPEPQVVVVPGGPGSLTALGDRRVLEYLAGARASGALLASVCTGSLVLGAAGMLRDRRASTHWAFRGLLAEYGAIPVDRRWVADGDVWTSAGVTAGLDMALALAETLAGRDAADLIRLDLEYETATVRTERLRHEYRDATRVLLRDRLPADLPSRDALLGALR
jgi:transcriptional regulator GlxA family with amidase domain